MLFKNDFAPAPVGAAPWYDSTTLKFRPHIESRRTELPPIPYTAKQAEAAIAARYGSTTLLEALKPDMLVKPYFDYEFYSEGPTNTAVLLEDDFIPAILQALSIGREQLAVAQRHGFVKGKGFKTSFRGFVQGRSVRVKDMAAILAKPQFADSRWDKGIYPTKGERIMGVVGGIKGKDGDVRVLRPVPGEPSLPYHHFLIQALDGAEEALEVPPGSAQAKRSKRGEDLHSEAAAAQHDTVKPRWLLISNAMMTELAEDYLRRCVRLLMALSTHRRPAALTCGLICPFRRAKMRVGYELAPVEGNRIYMHNTKEVPRVCMHGEEHVANNAHIIFLPDHDIVYKCYSSECCHLQPISIGTWEPTAPSTWDDLCPKDMDRLDPGIANALHAAGTDAAPVPFLVVYLNRWECPQCRGSLFSEKLC